MARGRGRQPTQQPAPPRTGGRRAAPVNFREDPGSGEEFDFTGVDEHSPDGDPVAGSATSTRRATPLEQPSESSRSRTAPDIDYFYIRGSKVAPVTRTLCKTCKANGIDLRQGAGSFSVSTSNNPLRNHLLSRHKDIYLQKCREMRWKVPALKSETGTPPASGRGTQRSPFSQNAFLQYLLNFIVANDQSIYVVECPEFRQLLLLLREDLEDKDIPHRTMMRKLIIKAWEAYFKVLKQELAGGHWTLDNCSLNDAFLKELEILLRPREVEFNHKENHIRCFPHITNICSTHVIEAFTNIALVDDTGGFIASASGPPSDPDNQTYEEAVVRDPIALCQSTVRAVHASGQRREHLAEVIDDGNKKGWFKSTEDPTVTIQVKQAQLVAVEHFLSLPINRDLAKLRLTYMEWAVLQDFEIVLGYRQTLMSKEHTPVLSGAIPAFEMFMTAWEQLGRDHPCLARWMDIGIQWATTYYKKMDDSPAYVIAIFLNPSIQLSWIRRHWEPNYVARAIVIIKNTMRKYHDHLHGQAQQPTSSTDSQQQRRSWHDLAGRYGLEDMLEVSGAPSPSGQGVEEQFELYGNGTVSPRGTDIIGFWAISEETHQILYTMALDYLPIQASSVPSECVFSSSAETDTKRRNRIHPVLMEALQMLKFSLKQQRLNFTEGWAVTEDELEYHADDNEDLADLLGKLTLEIREDGIDIDEVIHVVGQDDDD
ncbi:uncharacterized protein LACBIDRAFT_335933 [Laccaria bicolor S238N-H82]|uniref:Predicted protein n=1 Tax=Laccaria bicolor (strain S238N-H82 / ATCC MYA-4686) TaxID=486041 RepID=B0E3V8_LACBS|nr:uncharacterized protein LACBIDRAFT_335933 [Laccaria bicolor S238N-H82]EDQ98471.1 predicted protein [Laccaria bicolor S238N-H82]|eukprot:XP_001890876.1 predicted protein [Laccaria bicolor S238N-H82]